MFVELFGPPGVGKTTLARTLAADLRERGYAAELRLSLRPIEADAFGSTPTRGTSSRILRRIRQPASELLSIACHPVTNVADALVATNLTRALPPDGVWPYMKHWQYIIRLAHSWRRLANERTILIFDQGFVQAVCSLVMASQAVDDPAILKCLPYALKADVIVHVRGGLDLIKTRLSHRLSQQAPSERLLEPDAADSADWSALSERIHQLLIDQGARVFAASSSNHASLMQSTEEISHFVTKLS